MDRPRPWPLPVPELMPGPVVVGSAILTTVFAGYLWWDLWRRYGRGKEG